jgi:cytochrome c peroxidase
MGRSWLSNRARLFILAAILIRLPVEMFMRFSPTRAGFFCALTLAITLGASAQDGTPEPAPVDPKQHEKAALGNILFNDTSLSSPAGQSCASCHKPDMAFSDGKVVSEGANKSPGVRNTPSLMYAQFAKPFIYEDWRRTWAGGQFWDGRADTLAEQALGPLLNPIEMGNTREALATRLRELSYTHMFEAIYGKAVFASDETLLSAAADALQAFQMTEIFAPFSSKFDYAQRGLVELTEQEKLGRRLHDGKASCIDCHSGWGDNKQLFGSFSYHNILTPPNVTLNNGIPDIGLAANPKLTAEEKALARGRFKAPTMRNIAKTAPYMHNGVFKTLREVIDYYNDVDDRKRWGPASFPETKSHMLKTKLDLTEEEIEALIAFLEALTDGYELPQQAASNPQPAS